MVDNVAAIIELEKQAEEIDSVAEHDAGGRRWDAARLIVEELDSGKSQRKLASMIDKDQAHVSRMAKVWRQYGSDDPGHRPPFNTAYAQAKRRVPKVTPSTIKVHPEPYGPERIRVCDREGNGDDLLYEAAGRVYQGRVDGRSLTEIVADVGDAGRMTPVRANIMVNVWLSNRETDRDQWPPFAQAWESTIRAIVNASILRELKEAHKIDARLDRLRHDYPDMAQIVDDGAAEVAFTVAPLRDLPLIESGSKTEHALRMLDTVPDNAPAPVARLTSALRSLREPGATEMSYLHACQAVTDIVASTR